MAMGGQKALGCFNRVKNSVYESRVKSPMPKIEEGEEYNGNVSIVLKVIDQHKSFKAAQLKKLNDLDLSRDVHKDDEELKLKYTAKGIRNVVLAAADSARSN